MCTANTNNNMRTPTTSWRPLAGAGFACLLLCLPLGAQADGMSHSVPPAPRSQEAEGPSGTLQIVGKMPLAYLGTMTLLPDGRILALAEWGRELTLWDPKLGTWRPGQTGPICHAGVYSVTPLSNGKVMVAGSTRTSYGCDSLQTSLWGSATEKWEGGPALLEQRAGQSVTPLPDGGALIVGGYAPGDEPDNHLRLLGSVELYDGAAVKSVPGLKLARAQYTATLLADGRVMVAGGADNEGDATGAVEIWSPKTQTWQDAPPLLIPRYGHSAALLADGRVMVMGGVNDAGQAMATVEIWDPATGHWSPGTPLLFPAANSSAALLKNGDVLFMGEAVHAPNKSPLRSPSAMLWESATGLWKPAGSMTVRGTSPSVHALEDGGALIFMRSGPVLVMRWTRKRSASSPIPLFDGRNVASAPLRDDRVLLAGGDDFAYSDGNAYQVADPPAPSSTYHPSPGYAHKNRKAGGEPGGASDTEDADEEPELKVTLTDGAEIFDPQTGRFSLTGRLRQPRMNHVLLTLDDGRVLAAGGVAASYEHPDQATDANSEVWDQNTGNWQVLGADLRFAPGQLVTVTKLGDGSVLFFAIREEDSEGAPDYQARIWNPQSGRVEKPAVSVRPRSNTDVAVMRDGRVLIVNGNEGSLDMWNSRTGAVTHIEEPRLENSRWRLLPLNNSQVLMVETFLDGARYARGRQRQSATLLWDPATGKFRAIGALPVRFTESSSLTGLDDAMAFADVGEQTFRLPGRGVVWLEEQRQPSAQKTTAPPGATLRPLQDAYRLEHFPALAKQEGWKFAYLNPEGRQWSVTSAGYAPRREPALAALADGRLMVAGGGEQKQVQLWNPADNSWHDAAPLAQGYIHPQAVRLPSGHVLLVGHPQAAQGTVSGDAACESWSPKTDTWASCGSFGNAQNFTLGQLDDGRAVVLLRRNGIAIFDEKANAWDAASAEVRYGKRMVAQSAYEHWTKAGGRPGEMVSAPLEDWGEVIDPSRVFMLQGLARIDITALAYRHVSGFNSSMPNALMMKGGNLLTSHLEVLAPDTFEVISLTGGGMFKRFGGRNMVRLPDGCALTWPPFDLTSPDGMRVESARGPHIGVESASVAALPDGTVVFAGLPDITLDSAMPGFARVQASCKGITWDTSEYAGMPGEDRLPPQVLALDVPPKPPAQAAPSQPWYVDWWQLYKAGIAAAIFALSVIVPVVLYYVLRRMKSDRLARFLRHGSWVARALGIGYIAYLIYAIQRDYLQSPQRGMAPPGQPWWQQFIVDLDGLKWFLLPVVVPLLLYIVVSRLDETRRARFVHYGNWAVRAVGIALLLFIVLTVGSNIFRF